MLINAKRMQNIAPKIKELQTRYKNDQLQLGQALMKLYKDEKVSPI
jgi:membrane protein insertase Oxa1/YidC/SpoIIIJ